MKINLPAAVTTRFARQVLIAQKNSPQLLFAGGIVLMGATVVTACQATLKVGDVLDDVRTDREDILKVSAAKPEKYDDRQVAKLNAYVTVKGLSRVVKLYLPAIALGVAAVACLTSSHNQLSRRNAGLSAALAATDRALKDYRRRVVDELGEDKDREFMFGTETKEIEVEGKDGKKKTKKVAVRGDGMSPYARIWGRDTTSEWDPAPEYNVAKLRAVQTYCTMVLNSRGHLFLNEVHDELGLDRTTAGAVVGWLSQKNGGADGYVDLGVLVKGEEVRFIDFMTGDEDHILLDFNVDGEIHRSI